MSNELLRAAEDLVRQGFNVLFVNRLKQPVGVDEGYRDYYEMNMTLDFLRAMWKKAKGRAVGIALMGNVNPKYPEYSLVLIDVDDPQKWLEVEQKLPPDVRKLLSGTWVWVTGPRCPVDGDKHDIECQGDRCRHGDHEFNLRDAQRGVAMAVLVPSQCLGGLTLEKLMGGAIELRVRGYELLPPSLHPSGAHYEWVFKPPTLPIELDCTQWRSLLNALGRREETRVSAKAGGDPCPGRRNLSEDTLQKLLELVKPVYIPGHRDYVLFGVVSQMWLRCIEYETARRFVEMLGAWAKEVYKDEDVKKDLYTVDWVYRRAAERPPGMPPKAWGRDRVIKAVEEVFKALGSDERAAHAKALEWLDNMLEIIGAPKRFRIMFTASWKGKEAGKNMITYAANDPSWGIARAVKYLPTRTELRQAALDECEDEVGEDVEDRKREVARCVREKLTDQAWVRETMNRLATWGYDLFLPNWYIMRARKYVDAVSNFEYVNVVLRNTRTGEVMPFKWITVEDLVRELVKDMMTVEPEETIVRFIRAIINAMTKRRVRHVVAGIVNEKGKVRLVARGEVAPYLKQLMSEDGGDPRAFVSLLRTWYNDDTKVWLAYTVGLFQVFNFLRKQFGRRNKFLVLAGERNTGKSSIGLIIVTIMYNMPDTLVVKGASTLFSPARLARAVIWTTMPVLIDEAAAIKFNPTITEMLKNLATGMHIYEQARPYQLKTESYPAYAGAIMTVQTLFVDDPGLADRLFVVHFSAEDVKPPELHTKFNEWVIQNAPGLRAFARLYLRTAIEEWDKVKDIILAGDYVTAAIEYMKYVLAKIGEKMPELTQPQTAPEHEEGEVTKFIKWLVREARQAMRGEQLDDMSLENIVETAITRGYLKPYVFEDSNGVGIYITSNVVREARLINLKNLWSHLCSELRGRGVDVVCIDSTKPGVDEPGDEKPVIRYGVYQKTTVIWLRKDLLTEILKP